MYVRWVLIVLLLSPVVHGAPQDDGVKSVKILIAYDSRTGNTESLARAVAEGAGSVAGVEVVLRRQREVEADEIASADGILVGTPVHWANLSVETKAFLDRIGGALATAGEIGADSAPRNRTGGAFVTGGSVASGKELARLAILAALLNLKFVVVGGADAAGFGTLGAQATTGPRDPGLSEVELDEARQSGARFATLTKRLATGAP